MKKNKCSKLKTPADQTFQKTLTEMLEARAKEFDSKFRVAVRRIPEIFRQFSVRDIATSLFVSHLWLPNISSLMKHQLLAAIFASMKPEQFSGSDVIISYDHFEKLMQQIYPLLPTFYSLEDYIPEPDWGEVKFYHENKNFRIFYGNELSNVYDYLILFQILYLPYNEGYSLYASRSATEDLRNCLRLQDDIISSIFPQPISGVKEIPPGHIEIPPKSFWGNVADFYSSYKPEQRFDDLFLKSFGIPLGNWDSRYLQNEVFFNMACVGKVLPVFFCHSWRSISPNTPKTLLFNTFRQLGRSFQKIS